MIGFNKNTRSESNEKLARFLGWFTEDGQSETWFELMDNAQYVIYQQHNDIYKELPFHKDWNYLMQIVEKIENLQFKVNVFGKNDLNVHYVVIYNEKGTVSIVNDKSLTKIEAVYNACVEFVDWYNQQTK